MSDVTRIIDSVRSGDPQAAKELLPLVYDELRKLALVCMAGGKTSQTPQPTALLLEARSKIAGDGQEHFANRRHFFQAAATALLQIPIDNARRKQQLKHGANLIDDELHELRIAISVPSAELLAVNEVEPVMFSRNRFP